MEYFVLVGPRLEKSGVGKHGNWALSLMSDEVERELVPSVQGVEKADDQDAVWKCGTGMDVLEQWEHPPFPFVPPVRSCQRNLVQTDQKTRIQTRGIDREMKN